MKRIIYSLLILLTLTTSAQSLREIYQAGVQAYEAKDYELFNRKMLVIDSMRPNYPAVVYNLAGSYALTGQKSKSIKILNKYILMDATQDFTKDSDFESILTLKEFEEIKQRQVELTSTISIEKSISFPILDSHPESITYSAKQKSYFFGGVRDGKIWKVKDGEEPILFADSPKNSWCVMGLELSPDNKTLWVCTASLSNYKAYDQNEEGYSSVIKYNAKSGELLETFALPRGHVFGDLVVDKNGNVFISDGTANTIYWISQETGELEKFADLSDQVFNLQGLTFDQNQEHLYLSDYIDGIYKLNLDSKEVIKLFINTNEILIKGIDGLYFDKGSLIGLHNGTKPNRVIRYQLSESGDTIIGKKILAQAGDLGEPTQGVWVNDKFHFILNSPWGAYDQDGNFEPEGDSIIIGVIE